MAFLTLTCPCLFGVESILAGEIKRIGGQDITATDGRVTFKGDASMIARANILLRTAERVLIVLGSFRAQSFTELFDAVYALPLEEFIGKQDAFPVAGWSINSKLMSIPDCQAIIKKAAAKRLGEHYCLNWLEETGAVYQIRFSIHKDVVTIMLDTSGQALHKRGYRAQSNLAPMKETLAAAIVDLARVKKDTLVIDPLCGSGTLVIEAAMKALKIPPGLRRRFAAESWGILSKEEWQEIREETFANVARDGTFQAQGFDNDEHAVNLTRNNAAKAGVAGRIKCELSDIADFVPPEEPFILLTNPPYGERLLDIKQAEQIYRTMGKVFTPAEGRSYYIISPHEQFEQFFGRAASRRRKLYNGNIKCNLFMFF